MSKQAVRLLGLMVLVGWISPASAADPWDWTVSAIPNQTYNSREAAEAALRALGTQSALAEVVENTQMSATGTTYTYGARGRGPDIGPWVWPDLSFSDTTYNDLTRSNSAGLT